MNKMSLLDNCSHTCFMDWDHIHYYIILGEKSVLFLCYEEVGLVLYWGVGAYVCCITDLIQHFLRIRILLHRKSQYI